MHPVSASAVAEGPAVGIAEQHIPGAFVEAQLLKMLIACPLPDNIALPIHL
ncbi:hypothetical protein D3C75_1276880 [compost metagenome]